jgi:hypothetical protein
LWIFLDCINIYGVVFFWIVLMHAF